MSFTDNYTDPTEGAYSKFFDKLGKSRFNTENLFTNLLTGIANRRGATADNYAGMRNAIDATQASAVGQTQDAYSNARNRMQASPQSYQQPQSAAYQLNVPNVGADQATMNALATAAGNQQNAANAAQTQLYDTLAQSDAANRASRLSDVDLAQAGSLAQLSALGSAQQFGLSEAELAALAAIDQQYSNTELAKINALSGFDEQDLSATLTQIANAIQAERDAIGYAREDERNAVTDSQVDRNSDQAAIATAVSIFSQMIDPIVDQIDPQSVIDLWVAFAGELGIPVADAVAMIGA